jgi:hypothetical protein
MKKIMLLVAIASLLGACNKSSTKTNENEKVLTAPTASAITFPADFKPTQVFNADKADLHESLKIQPLDDKTIAYELAMENGGCEAFSYRGVAILTEGDMESDQDSEGNGFDVSEYTDTANGKCSIYVRLGVEEYKNHARFIIADCTEKHCADKKESEPLLSE